MQSFKRYVTFLPVASYFEAILQTIVYKWEYTTFSYLIYEQRLLSGLMKSWSNQWLELVKMVSLKQPWTNIYLFRGNLYWLRNDSDHFADKAYSTDTPTRIVTKHLVTVETRLCSWHTMPQKLAHATTLLSKHWYKVIISGWCCNIMSLGSVSEHNNDSSRLETRGEGSIPWPLPSTLLSTQIKIKPGLNRCHWTWLKLRWNVQFDFFLWLTLLRYLAFWKGTWKSLSWFRKMTPSFPFVTNVAK